MDLKIRDFFEGREALWPVDRIIQFVEASKQCDEATGGREAPEALLLFQTSRQQTWLVTTSQRLYCVLDDKRKNEPELRWVMNKDELVTGDALKVALETHDHSENSGLVDIGPNHKDWFFTKSLFADEPVEAKIHDLVTKKMI